jgi:ABC-type nitrate/sulfonate/bicarbonate transport system permease component
MAAEGHGVGRGRAPSAWAGARARLAAGRRRLAALPRRLASRRARRGATALASCFLLYGFLTSRWLEGLGLQHVLPSYAALLDSWLFLLGTGGLVRGMAASVVRMGEGYLLGAVVGVTLGGAMGWSRRADFLLDPLVQVVRFTPALAWLPLFMIWFGTGQASMVMLIATGVAVVTLTAAYHAVRDVADVHLKAARMLGAPRWLLFSRVVLPAALPQISDGLRVAIGVSWTIIVAAELIGAPSGLGYLLVTAREYLNIPLVLVVMLHIGLLALVMDRIGMAAHRRATRWMKRQAPGEA